MSRQPCRPGRPGQSIQPSGYSHPRQPSQPGQTIQPSKSSEPSLPTHTSNNCKPWWPGHSRQSSQSVMSRRPSRCIQSIHPSRCNLSTVMVCGGLAPTFTVFTIRVNFRRSGFNVLPFAPYWFYHLTILADFTILPLASISARLGN